MLPMEAFFFSFNINIKTFRYMRKGILIFYLLLATNGMAQVNMTYYLDSDHPYNPMIPTPQSVLGYEVGEWHVSHDKLVGYMHQLAAASERIHIESRGTTFEGRPIVLLTITSPENHQKIDQIQSDHMALTERGSTSIEIKDQPLIVYQGFSIHGNEPSGSNAGLLAAYHLAASEAAETIDMLESLVILFDPSLNPDGLQRFAYWANTNRSMHLNADPNDREFNEVWPRGRTNHYWFDLNRDWLPAQLPESRARIKTFTRWLPNILTDHHEMGTNSSFFFQPGIPTRVHPLTPKMNQALTQEIGKYHAAAFDKIGSLYYSEEDYDDFYYGKGSTYPDVNGSIGILFEQASSRGHVQESDNGLLTFPFTVRNQLTAAFSTLKAAHTMRVKLLDYMRQFYNDARTESSKSKQKAIVIGHEKDPATLYHLAETMERHKIGIHRLKESFIKDGKKYTPENSYVIPLNQKKNRLIRAMFETQTVFEDSLFYDISAWSFPLAFNINHSIENNEDMMGSAIKKIEHPKGSVDKKGTYAYLFEAHNYYTPKALRLIQEKNIRVKVGMKPFIIEGEKYDYGSYMIPVQNQVMDADDLFDFLKTVADKSHVKISGYGTGTTKGIDLGSRNFNILKKPKVAMLVGDGVRSYDAGEIWHLMDTRYEIPLTKIDIRDLGRSDLSRYTHFILPSYSGSALKASAEKLKSFTLNGGTLIGYRSAVSWLQKNDFIKLEFLKSEKDAKGISFDQRQNYFGAKVIGGAIFNTKIDRSHPINFGFVGENLPMFRNTTLFIAPNKQSFNNPIQYTENPLLNGYISKDRLKLLRNSVPFQVQSLGKGKVIVLTDNTNFRAFWYGTNRLLSNAIYLSDKM